MISALKEADQKLASSSWGFLPPRMHVLFITGTCRTGGWLAEAFASDSASQVVMDEAIGVAAGLARLRDEVFDAVLVGHEGEGLDALDLLDAIRTGSSEEQPIIVLGAQSEQEMSALCYESGGDDYVCVNASTTRTLIWKVARAVERHRLIADNRRLRQEHQHRLQREHEEAARLLEQQRALIAGMTGAGGAGQQQQDASDSVAAPLACPDLPATLIAHYRELLRTYVIMGSGNLSHEMQRLAELLTAAGVTSTQAMLLHLHVLEEMVEGLGSRSARHVMNRADLLILEMTISLAEGYRRRYVKRVHPPEQMLLPGFAERIVA